MSGHGIVVPNENGTRASCMGPGMCAECNLDMQDATQEQRDVYYTRCEINDVPPEYIQQLRARFDVVRTTAMDEPAPVSLNIAIGDRTEMDLIRALDNLTRAFPELSPDEISRAAQWFHAKWSIRMVRYENDSEITTGRELRALRVWHWRRVMAARAAAKCYRQTAPEYRTATGTAYNLRQAKACDRRADFHIKCVQALDDVVSGTAEADDKTMPRESLHNE